MIVGSDKEFFNRLYDEVKAGNAVHNVRMHNGKIYKYSQYDNKKKAVVYETTKNSLGTLTDIVDYELILKLTKCRFYDDDYLYRNGFFNGLVGTSYDNITKWEECDKSLYSMYDVDINKAYLSLFYFPLPQGHARLWKDIDPCERRRHFIRFFHIDLKSEPNRLGIFIPPHPKPKYKEFDFFAINGKKEMIVSAPRLELIQEIYGTLCYEIIEIYGIYKQRYKALERFADDYKYRLEKLKREKAAFEVIANAKKQALMLVGMIGHKDYANKLVGLRAEYGRIYPEFVTIKRKQRQYLPLPMYISDVVALRLFNEYKKAQMRFVTWNTDGYVGFCQNTYIPENTATWGGFKSELIKEPIFFDNDFMGRPLIYDSATNKVYNATAVTYNSRCGGFYLSERHHINFRDGYEYKEYVRRLKVNAATPRHTRKDAIIALIARNYPKIRDYDNVWNKKAYIID